MIMVNNNTPQQINSALISLNDEIKSLKNIINTSSEVSSEQETDNPSLSEKKNIQSPVSDPIAYGDSLSFISSISQNAQGVINPTKSTIPTASTSSLGVVQLDSVPTQSSSNVVTSNGLYNALGNKQDTLVSGTNIKTINNLSLLGSGNIDIQGGSPNDGVLTIQKNGTDLGTFSANQATNKTIDISVPTSLSQLSDDSNHRVVTDTDISKWNGYATSKQDTLSSTQMDAVNSGIDSTKVTQIGTNQTSIGDLSQLSTTDKSDLVSAINEVASTAGAQIDDTTISSTSVWSSSKVNTELLGKKDTQTAVSDPTSSGNSLSFIATISQDTQGVITPTKSTVPTASTSSLGVVQLDSVPTQSSNNAVTSDGLYTALGNKQDTLNAGDGIDITNDVISQTTDQLTFTGTQAQWDALSSAERAKYGLFNRLDDEVTDENLFRFNGITSSIYTSSSYDQSIAHSLTQNLTLTKGLYFLRAMARNVSAGVTSNNITIEIGGFIFINCWDTSNAGWSNAIDAVVLPIGSSQSCVVTVTQPIGFQYEVSITKLS